MKNRIMNKQRHNGKWCIWNLYRSRIQAWTQTKTENAQRINIKLRKIYDTKARNKNSRKVLQEVMTIMEKQDLRQNLYGFKKENTQTHDRQKK